jgi:hypothetical protein
LTTKGMYAMCGLCTGTHVNREVVAEGDIVALKGHASRSDGAQTINSAGGVSAI